MKSLKLKKVLFTMLALTAVFMLFTVTAYADDYGDLSYTTVEPEDGEDFEAYICITSYSSDNEEAAVVEIPSEIDDVPVTTISASAFSGKSLVKDVIIPDSVTTIENAAFYNCSDLQTIIIPDSVTYIGESAFQNCTSLENVIIGNGVKAIGDVAFKNCSALKILSIGTSVEEIGNGAFFNCGELKAVRIPDSVAKIGTLAFGYIQDGNDEAAVDGFTFYTNSVNTAVTSYAASATTVDEDVTSADVSLFTVVNGNSCSEHNVSYTNARVATESYDGIDIAICADCGTVVTAANYDIAEEEDSNSALITLIVVAVAVIAFVVLVLWYIKKSKANRLASIEAYKAGKPLPDAAEKKAQDEKEAEKYAKKKAKQEANLRKYIDIP